MSTKSINPLEVTGSFLEIPPAKEPTKAKTTTTIIPIEAKSFRSPTLVKSNTSRSSRQSTTEVVKKSSANNELKDQQIKNLEEELRRLRKRNEELEQQMKTVQKVQKDKEKQIELLTKQLTNQESVFNEKQKELQKLNDSLKSENDSLLRQLTLNEDFKKSSIKTHDEFNRLKSEFEANLRRQREEHQIEMKLKDDKLNMLKKQIAEGLKDNSWERHLQIEELAKELKRSQEECEIVKYKLKSYKSKNTESCTNCGKLVSNESLIIHLFNLLVRYSTTNLATNMREDDLNKLYANTAYNEILSKLNLTINKNNNNNNDKLLAKKKASLPR